MVEGFPLLPAASSGSGIPPPAPSVLQVEAQNLDVPLNGNGLDTATDWSRSYHGLSTQPFPKEVAEILMAPIDPNDVEMKPGALNIAGPAH